jgi:hypothetical protein
MNETLYPLSFLIGTWQTTGEIVATEEQPAISFHGTDTYEWVLDRKFIRHTVDIRMGEDEVKAIEMIYPDRNNATTFILTSYDNTGQIETMAAQISGDRLLMAGNGKQAVLTWENPGRMSAFWNMTLTLEKI